MATREGADGSLSARNGHRQHRKLDCGPPAEQQLWYPLLTRRYFSAVFSEVNPVLRVPPMPLTAVMIMMLMPAAIRQYSIAVAPESSSRNFEISRPISKLLSTFSRHCRATGDEI